MRNFSIVHNGRLTVPLFHGTSSLHLESIRSAGLGGRIFVEEMGIRRAADFLGKLVADVCADDDWLLDVELCRSVAADQTYGRLTDPQSGRPFACRYGATYLSASRETAANYALYYPNDGEALTQVLKLYRRLLARMPELASNGHLAPLVEFTREPGAPVLVETLEVPVCALRTERSGGLEYLLARVEKIFQDDPEDYGLMVGQINFELVETVPPGQLRFYQVAKVTEYDGEGGSRETLKFSEFKLN